MLIAFLPDRTGLRKEQLWRFKTSWLIYSHNVDTDFANGWRKLPDELNIEVLKHNLVSDKPITYHRSPVYSHHQSTFVGGDFKHNAVLRHHLALSLEAAALALQVFYEKNLVQEPSSSKLLIYIPPQTACRYVVQLTYSQLDVEQSWILISKLASTAFGFDGLQYLILVFEVQQKQCVVGTWHDCTRYVAPRDPIVFKCKGVVKFISNGPKEPDCAFLSHEEVEKCILEKMIFVK
ncbi:hypothetical protein EKO04_011251 [Ascochyta lentis]|uniref:Uncharacterized protein n=1 Tax=Ascochyta lentis TaxID=205686 RepID=A0A8H7MBG4_9PLEO|nr:hypothetical protein EKO04_011251 [Ascochyta lentis]